MFSISDYTEKALKRAEYCRDENGVVVGCVPGSQGFFAQGDNFEEARANLREVIEGNVVLALQLGLPIPEIEGVRTTERVARIYPVGSSWFARQAKSHSKKTRQDGL